MPRKKKLAEQENPDLPENAQKPLEIPHFKASVRSLVAFSVEDDATWTFSSYKLAQEGSLAHARLQARCREAGNYLSEVTLSYTFEAPGCTLEVNGRADGVWRQDGRVIVHEIKTSATPLSDIGEDFSEAHWAQGKCYAFLLASLENLPEIWVRLSYYDKDADAEKAFERRFSFERLKRFFKALLFPYAAWALAREKWRNIRNLSIKTLDFPYARYRKGQKLLAYNTYKCIEDGKRLFAQAPTGTGKTMGVLYPAIKALGEGKIDRIFYVTAKTTTRGIAENAYKMLAEQGVRLKVLTLTAKDKLCLNTVKNCNPEKCLYIQGFILRARRIVKELLKKHDFFSREKIEEIALRHGICPFELSLELAMSCDLIIGDYNYVFDPRIRLRRFFQQKGREEYLILVDEAHNLFDRAREMYSASLSVMEITELAKEIRKDLPDLYKSLRKLKKGLSDLEKACSGALMDAGGVRYHASSSIPAEIRPQVHDFITRAESRMLAEQEEKPYDERLATFFFDILHFKNILDLFSSNYRTLATGSKGNFRFSLVCLDPGPMLNRSMAAARSTVLFSATLSPLWYFKSILGGRSEDATLRLPSPFPRENLLIVNEDRIETRYRHRERYLSDVAAAIRDWVSHHKGNNMVFFPSYRYLLDVLERFRDFEGEFEILCQDREMDESQRKAFLAEFEAYGDVSRVAFCVMGGIFGEGIDLTGDRLTGVIIVGVGLPQVSPELELLRSYYQEKNGNGFAYAYTYPGLNKVLQAAGRLIRTEADRGGLLLIDSRFASPEYMALLPEEWHPIPRTSCGANPSYAAKHFWGRA